VKQSERNRFRRAECQRDERLGELRQQGITLIEEIEGLHARFDRIDAGQQQVMAQFDELKAMLLAQGRQAPDRLLLSLAAAYGEAQPEADPAALEAFLRDKIDAYHALCARVDELEAADKREAALIAEAWEAVENGRFDQADALLGEAEARERERLIVIQRSIAGKRAMRGDIANLGTNFAGAMLAPLASGRGGEAARRRPSHAAVTGRAAAGRRPPLGASRRPC